MLSLCSRDTVDAASRKPSAAEIQLRNNPTYDSPRGPGDDNKRTGAAEALIQESLRNE